MEAQVSTEEDVVHEPVERDPLRPWAAVVRCEL